MPPADYTLTNREGRKGRRRNQPDRIGRVSFAAVGSENIRPWRVKLDRDRAGLPTFCRFPKHLRRKLRTIHVIEHCFAEVRRRTRPMVCFVIMQSVDRNIYSIFQRFNLKWKTRTLRLFTQAV